jgi:serine palmitoyltransferase
MFMDAYRLTGTKKTVLNLSSYNYLGFAQAQGQCADHVETTVAALGISSASTRAEAGTLQLHRDAEALVARFMGVEDAMIISMGYATNSTTIPSFVSKGSLIISDELNHASLVNGARVSGASIRVFKHNDVDDLEKVLRESISQGQPRTHRPWKKILVVVEGLYSMEGDFCNLPGIVALKDKYKFYLFLDEAHSIGAMGPRGRGMCDYFGVNPKDVDILMGTFTKSFGAAGGYISGTKALIDHLKLNCHSQVYAEAVSVPVLAQIMSSLRMIMGEDGTDEGARKLKQLAFNARYFSTALRDMGFMILGNVDSPVIPLVLFHPAKLAAFSRMCLERGLAVVVVGYPATPVTLGRVRFCLSAAHTKEDLDHVLAIVGEVGDLIGLKIKK